MILHVLKIFLAAIIVCLAAIPAIAGDECGWSVQQNSDGKITLAHDQPDDLHLYAASYRENSIAFARLAKKKYPLMGQPLTAMQTSGEFILPKDTNRVVLISSKVSLKDWSSQDLTISTAADRSSVQESLAVTSLGTGRDMSDVHGVPSEKGNDVVQYCTVVITN